MANTEQTARRRLETAGELFELNHARFMKRLERRVEDLCDHEKYREAEEACLDALEKTERGFGPDTPEVVPVLSHLLSIYSCQSLYAKVEECCQRAIGIIGEDHPDYVDFADSLAEVYAAAGRHKDAEILYKQLLAFNEQQYGLQHPELIEWLNQFAMFYAGLDRFKEAEPYLQRVLAIVQDCAGEDVCSLSVAMFNLASLYCCLERYREAEFLIKRALKLRSNLGSDDSCYRALAAVYVQQGRYDEAERIYTRCLTQDQHPMFDLDCMIELALLHELRGDSGQAKRMYKKAVDVMLIDTFPVAPAHLNALGDLADLHASGGRDDQAAIVYRCALEIADRQYGDNPFCLLDQVNDLVRFYESRERFDEARPYLERKAGILERSFGPGHSIVEETRASMDRRVKAPPPVFPRPRFNCDYIFLSMDIF